MKSHDIILILRYTGPSEARLHNQPSTHGQGAWIPKHMEASLHIEFGQEYTLKSVRTQGSPDGTKFMTRFFLFYTVDGKQWKPAYGVSRYSIP